MRLIGRGEDERHFAEYLLRIGNGTEPGVQEEQSTEKSSAEIKIVIPERFLSKASDKLEFIKEIFPNLSNIITQGRESDDTSWHDWLCERAIICPTNADVNKINKAVVQDFPGDPHIYRSHDVCLTKDQVRLQFYNYPFNLIH